MKELSIEQKARCYDEAKTIMGKYLNSGNAGVIAENTIKKAFPELREPDDEKIKQAIIEHFADSHSSMYPYKGFTKKQILDWIERQGEQKPNKVEPKFKAGDWIVFNGLTLCVRVVVNGFYVTTSRDGVTNSYDCSIDNAARLWTIQDAKDGDVLVVDTSVILFRKIGNKKYGDVVDYHCVVDSGKFEIQEKDFYWGRINDVPQLHPATKEQRDALMKAIADAGYTFDFEKKELKKIEQKPQHIVSAEAMNDKNAWSEKDEKMLNGVILDLTFLKCEANSNEGKKAYQREIDLLKSLKDKQEWNEDDKRRFNGIIADIEAMKEQAFNIGAKVAYQKEIDWLKDKVQPQPKQEWSEEDEYHKRQILRILKDNGCSQALQERTEKWIEERLKPLRPQAQWKPTDKQMCNLSYAAHHHCAFFDVEILKGLYDDLKKL